MFFTSFSLTVNAPCKHGECTASLRLVVRLRPYYPMEDLVLLMSSKTDNHPVYSYRLASRMRGCSMWRVDLCANKPFLHYWVYKC